MKKSIKAISAAFIALTLTACSAADGTGGEIQIPIYNAEEKVETYQVTRQDLSESQSMAASIGYALSDALSTTYDGNLVSMDIRQYQYLNEGDVIAVIDSSALDYTYLEQEIIMEGAYADYQQSGSEADRIRYEYEKARLDAIQYEIDSYTIKAPYDCIVSHVASLEIGAELPRGTYVCSVAKADEIYVYTGVDPSSSTVSPFQLGSKVNVTLTGNSYEGTVVSVPKSRAYNKQEQAELQPLVWGGFGGNNLPSVDSSKNAIIGFEPDVLAAMLEETSNAVVAGWATVSVVTSQMNNVLCVPSNAVSNRAFAYLYEDGHKVQIPVETGPTINGYTVILSGLKEGDVVVIRN